MALRERLEQQAAEGEPGARIEDCSCPRGGGWRPGARWAKREELQAEIDEMPTHQRPLMREMGRRSEAAEVPFRKGRGEALTPARASGRGQYEGARAEGSRKLRSRSYPNPLPLAGEGAMVTTHRVGNRNEIAAVSPEAAALGLHPGMPLTQARAMVPGLDIREAQPDADAALLDRLALFAARRWTPAAAVSDPTGLWLDLGGVAHLFGGERRMCARILAFCARLGLSARIAVAGTLGAAHALARHGSDAIALCPSGSEAGALARLPLDALRIDAGVLNAARRLGIEHVGELIAMPRAPLARRFGKTLLTRLDQALGRAAEPLDPIVPQECPSACARLAEPIATAEAIEQVLGDLMAAFIATLEKQGLAARRALLICARIDGEEQRIAIGMARATRNGAHLLRLLKMRIERIEPGFGIEAMELIAVRYEPLAPVAVDGALAGEKPVPDLAPLIDRLAGRIGPRHLYRIGAFESDVPERSVRRVPPLGMVAEWPRWPRPIRLFERPERVDKVMAELPDNPPKRFVWRGRMHRVARADGPERIYGEWWRNSGEADAVRDYFQIEDEEGGRFWLYRRGDGLDARTGDLSWWLQGTFG